MTNQRVIGRLLRSAGFKRDPEAVKVEFDPEKPEKEFLSVVIWKCRCHERRYLKNPHNNKCPKCHSELPPPRRIRLEAKVQDE